MGQYAGINNKYGKKGHLYDLSAKLLSQTKGSFMVICLENSDKFYFLHRIKCNLQTVCKDMGWVIVHQQLFNRDLVIGMGLAEKGMSDMTIFRTKNEDIYKIWKDVLHFVFLGNGLPNIDYFSYDTSFIGQDYAHDIEYYYIMTIIRLHVSKYPIKQDKFEIPSMHSKMEKNLCFGLRCFLYASLSYRVLTQ